MAAVMGRRDRAAFEWLRRQKGWSMKKNGAAFTLIEMLVVVAIIMILMGLLFPAFSYARQLAKKTKAKSDVKQLDIAWKGVYSDYRNWPSANVPSTSGWDMNAARVSYLAGGNDKGIAYMEFDGTSTNVAGFMIDPWYDQKKNVAGIYQAALSAPGFNFAVTRYGQVNRLVAAWSRGSDGLDDNAHQGDDVKSWE